MKDAAINTWLEGLRGQMAEKATNSSPSIRLDAWAHPSQTKWSALIVFPDDQPTITVPIHDTLSEVLWATQEAITAYVSPEDRLAAVLGYREVKA